MLNENFAAYYVCYYNIHFEYAPWEKKIKNQNTESAVWIKDHLIWEEGQVLLTCGM